MSARERSPIRNRISPMTTDRSKPPVVRFLRQSANCPKATLYVQKYLNGQKKRSIDFYIAPYQKAKNQSGRGRVKFIFNPQYLQAQNHIYLSVRL
jgi:hypothetical protein